MYTRMKLAKNPRKKITTRYRGNRAARRYARTPTLPATKLGKLGLNGYASSLFMMGSVLIGRALPKRNFTAVITAATVAYETKKSASYFLFFQKKTSARNAIMTNRPISVPAVLPRNVSTEFSNVLDRKSV